MNNDISELMKGMSWWTAERFKSLQRKLTTASNTIRKDALSEIIRPFLTSKEIKTLQDAVIILSSVKAKIEHAKEIKERAEREREHLYRQCEDERRALCKRLMPSKDRDILLLRLALGGYARDFSKEYFPESEFIVSILRHAINPTHHFYSFPSLPNRSE